MTVELGIVLTTVLGIAFGVLVTNWIWFRRLYGIFKIDCTDPNKDTCRLELNSLDLDTLAQKKYIVLEVDAEFPDSRD